MNRITTVSTEALRYYWHPVAFSADVTDRPRAVTLLDERVVLYRTASGRAVAHKDLCIHRGTPLSLGWVEDETLVCAYHGWSYAPDGKCIRIPSVDPARKIPPKARLTTFKVDERYGIVWVCFGEPAAPVADFPEFDNASFLTFLTEQDDWNASAARLVENFVDTAHFAWVHPGLLGNRDKPRVPPIMVSSKAHTIDVTMRMEVANAVHKGSYSEIYDQITLPFTLRQVRTDPDGGRHIVFLAISPISSNRLRRFSYKMRDYDLNTPNDRFIEKSSIVAAQDRAIVEEQRPEELPVDLTAELHIKGPDDPALVYRKALAAIGVEVH
jgi:phenylpropionate dioxygenase-like ring-hydroxylating dioxygenase large terminal subunit